MSIIKIQALFVVVFLSNSIEAAKFSPTTVSELISAINTANNNNQDDVIRLGDHIFLLSASNNNDALEGANGLPSILPDAGHSLTLENGTILRNPSLSTPAFRLIRVVSGATLELKKIHLENGLASDDANLPYGTGGGCIINEGALEIRESSFLNCKSFSLLLVGDAGGGAIYNLGSIPLIDLSVFSGNESRTGSGGAIINTAGASIGEISKTTFSSNQSFIKGGAIDNIEASTIETIFDSAFFDNTAGSGGALYNNCQILSISNSTLSNNNALGEQLSIDPPFSGGGGALLNEGTIDEIVNSTIAFNNAAGMGGGIDNPSEDSVVSEFISNIVARNLALGDPPDANGPDIFNGEDATLGPQVSFNLIGTNNGNQLQNGVNNNLVGSDTDLLDPLLGPLKNNGGPTFTRALLEESPAIDAGANPNGLRFDQRDSPFVRTYGPQTDIGAYEVQPFPERPHHEERECEEALSPGLMVPVLPPPMPWIPPFEPAPPVIPVAEVPLAPILTPALAPIEAPLLEPTEPIEITAVAVESGPILEESNTPPNKTSSSSGCSSTDAPSMLLWFMLSLWLVRRSVR